jgi:hypothetical protein
MLPYREFIETVNLQLERAIQEAYGADRQHCVQTIREKLIANLLSQKSEADIQMFAGLLDEPSKAYLSERLRTFICDQTTPVDKGCMEAVTVVRELVGLLRETCAAFLSKDCHIGLVNLASILSLGQVDDHYWILCLVKDQADDGVVGHA